MSGQRGLPLLQKLSRASLGNGYTHPHPETTFPRLLCSQMWSCDRVLANWMWVEVMWTTSRLGPWKPPVCTFYALFLLNGKWKQSQVTLIITCCRRWSLSQPVCLNAWKRVSPLTCTVTWATNKLLFKPLYIFFSLVQQLAYPNYYVSCLIQLLSLCAEGPCLLPFS